MIKLFPFRSAMGASLLAESTDRVVEARLTVALSATARQVGVAIHLATYLTGVGTDVLYELVVVAAVVYRWFTHARHFFLFQFVM